MDTSTGMPDDEPSTFYDYSAAVPPVVNDPVRIFFSQFVPTLYSLVFIFGLVGNALVVLILVRFKKLKSMTDIYLLNLAISDLLFIFSLPFWAHHARTAEWMYGDAMCKILHGIYRAGFYSGSFFIILLTIDRYLAIVHAVFALRARTAFYGTLSSIITWLVAFLASVPAFTFNHVQDEFGLNKCRCLYPLGKEREWKEVVTLMMFILGIAVPWVIMVFCYVQIIMILINGRNERKQKAVRLIFVIMIVYFILWMPYNITNLLQTYQNSISSCTLDINCGIYLDLAVEVTEIIAMVHCCLNPVIYAFVGEKFRKYLSILFQKHISVYFCKLCPGRHRPYFERSTSTSISTTEHDISTGL